MGGVHQQTNVKLPGYWTHERSAQLQDLADASKRERERGEGAERAVETRHESQGKGDGEAQVEGTDGDGMAGGFWNDVARCRAWLLA